MKIVRKGYGINSYPVLVFKKPSFKIKVNSKKYFSFIDFIRFILLHKEILFTFLWMIIIFAFSAQKSDVSGGLSTHMNTLLSNFSLFDFLFGIFPIRKCAHFLLYFVLGGLAFFAFRKFNNIRFTYIKSFILCFMYAIFDEFHQLFVLGRCCEFKDVLIDSLGAGICLLFLFLFEKVKLIRFH